MTTLRRARPTFGSGASSRGSRSVWMLAGLALLLIVPPIARLSPCTSDSPAVHLVGVHGAPWWWAMLWSVSLARRHRGVLAAPRAGGLPRTAAAGRSSRACSPRRSGCADTRSSRPRPPWPILWLRAHRGRSARLRGGVRGRGRRRRGRDGVHPATARHHQSARIAGSPPGYDFWLLPAERRLRARHGGPPHRPPLSAAVRAERARDGAREAPRLYRLVLRAAVRLPIVVATVVLLIMRPSREPGPFAFLFLLVWVPWALTGGDPDHLPRRHPLPAPGAPRRSPRRDARTGRAVRARRRVVPVRRHVRSSAASRGDSASSSSCRRSSRRPSSCGCSSGPPPRQGMRRAMSDADPGAPLISVVQPEGWVRLRMDDRIDRRIAD